MTPMLALIVASLLRSLGVSPELGPVLEAPRAARETLQHRATRFVFENRKEQLALELFDRGVDRIAPAALDALSHFVRCYRTDRERPMHPRLAEIVARTAEAFGRDEVDVISGYRARPFGAPHSKHFLGRAMDLRLPGVPAKTIAAWVWRNFRGVGVGLYPKQDFVHIDVRDVDVHWVDHARHGESGHARYAGRAKSEISLPAEAPHLAYDGGLSGEVLAPRAEAEAIATTGFRAGF